MYGSSCVGLRMHFDHLLLSFSRSSSVRRSARFARVPFDAVRGPTEMRRRHVYFNICNRKMLMSHCSFFDSLGEFSNSTHIPLNAMIRSDVTTHGYVAHYYIDDLDNFNVEEQYRLLYDLPDGRYVAPQVKRRMFYKGETASQALEHVRRFLPSPFSPNSLSPSLYDAPSLIDEERWHEARAKLRREGASYKS